MLLDLSEKVTRKNLVNYRSMDYSADLFSLEELFFTSLPMFESISSFEKCLSSDWGFSDGVELQSFRSLCSILDKFNVDDGSFKLDSNNLIFNQLEYLKSIGSGIMSGQYSCNEFEPEFRKIHAQFFKNKFRQSFCKDYIGKNKNGKRIYIPFSKRIIRVL